MNMFTIFVKLTTTEEAIMDDKLTIATYYLLLVSVNFEVNASCPTPTKGKTTCYMISGNPLQLPLDEISL